MFLQNTFWICRSSRSQIFDKIGFHKNFRNIHKKTSVLEYLFNKVTGLKACNFIKMRPQHRCFRNRFFYETPPVAASENGQRIFAEYCVQELKKNSAVEEGEVSTSRSKQREGQREIPTFCSIKSVSFWYFLIFMQVENKI